MRSAWLVVVAFLLAGCHSPPPIHTASGQPEITLTNVNAQCVRSGFMNGLINDGWNIETTSDTQIIAGKPGTDFEAKVLFIPMSSNGMRVVVSEAQVSDPGAAFDKGTLVTQNQPIEDKFEVAGDRLQASCGRR